ncbi:MAG: hypothetical protein MPK06_01410 [Alphaproteobacteria bacterium]|nr:hypothetical protein [Alphaproteobacteria bacterium]MDA8003985.1 hypothetical protein [Alphaproteobacteria bacterium]MDA8005188.1 hypothetical protein [Alphaproteobacteria bacterium]MDA8012651.1 hypothetical protein [Alphaproteobacteria bacterium]
MTATVKVTAGTTMKAPPLSSINNDNDGDGHRQCRGKDDKNGAAVIGQ